MLILPILIHSTRFRITCNPQILCLVERDFDENELDLHFLIRNAAVHAVLCWLLSMQACGDRVLRGSYEWEQHKQGRGHRKRVSSLKKKSQGPSLVDLEQQYSECK